MRTRIKIVRAYWGDSEKLKREIPPVPIYDNQIVYVWGTENESFLKERGFDTRLVTDDDPCEINFTNFLIRKLIAIKLALIEFNEIIFLDWDCYILRELDDVFYEYLRDKPVQIPLYSHLTNPIIGINESCIDNTPEFFLFKESFNYFISKYSWKLSDMLVLPNFGFFYSREVSIGETLLNIAIENKLGGCVDEEAMFIYANCELEDYIDRYHPVFVNGVSDFMTSGGFKISEVQKKFNRYISEKIPTDIYLEHM